VRDHLLSALREDFGEAGPLRSNLRNSARSIEISKLREPLAGVSWYPFL